MRLIPLSELKQSCTKCDGTGRAIKRINRRRDGTVSSVIYDLKNDCRNCQGTGLTCMEVSRG